MNNFTWITKEYVSDKVLIKGSIRKSIPKTHKFLERYILRIIQFYSGVNIRIPITADYDLNNYCIRNNIKYDVNNSKKIRKELDDILFQWCKDTNNLNGAKQWLKSLK